jgi:hypothetical protein
MGLPALPVGLRSVFAPAVPLSSLASRSLPLGGPPLGDGYPSADSLRLGVSAPVPHGVCGNDCASKDEGAYMPKRVDDVRLMMEREREMSLFDSVSSTVRELSRRGVGGFESGAAMEEPFEEGDRCCWNGRRGSGRRSGGLACSEDSMAE